MAGGQAQECQQSWLLALGSWQGETLEIRLPRHLPGPLRFPSHLRQSDGHVAEQQQRAVRAPPVRQTGNEGACIAEHRADAGDNRVMEARAKQQAF